MMRLVFVLFFLPSVAFAQAITNVDIQKDENHAIKEVILHGSGFGSKSLPLLYDTAGITYEKGAPNTTFLNFSSDRELTKADTAGNNKSPWQSVGRGVYIKNDPTHLRHPNAGSYYYGDNGKANLHNPRVHPRSGTPIESKKLYVSWWFKQQNETRDYFKVQLANVDPQFNPKEGDEFVVDLGPHWSGLTSARGRVIAYDAKTRALSANFFNQNNSNRLIDRPLRLEKSGVKATITQSLESQGSNKYIRVWESDGSKNTFRLSWTNVALYVADMMEYPRSVIPAKQWNHLELFVDQNSKTITSKVNSKVDFQGTYSEAADAAGHSPTIGLIGFDANIDLIQQIWMDDIYMDNSFKRITLGNASKHSQVTHEEVQFFSSWKDSEIRFTPNYGSLSRERPAYIYIYSEDGIPNANGIPFESPPKSPVVH